MNNGFYKKCYEEGLFTDLLLVCKGREFRAHKIILAGQSTFFYKACTVAMKEQAESRVELHDDPDLLACMLDFCYGRKTDVQVLGAKTCLHYAQLYTLGDKYGIAALQSLASRGLASVLEKVFVHDRIRKLEPELVDDLLAIIAHVYHNTLHNDSMRKMVARLPWKSSTMEPYRIKCTEFLSDIPEYASDVILYNGNKVEQYRDDWPILVEYTCPNCELAFMLDRKVALSRELSCYDCGELATSKHWQPCGDIGKLETREEEMIRQLF